jgi:hypothetical protein
MIYVKLNPAQQSVHLTGGILRHFRAFSTPKQNPALEVLSTPPHLRVTPTVGQFLYNKANYYESTHGRQRVTNTIPCTE